jgi:hypothetical protein
MLTWVPLLRRGYGRLQKFFDKMGKRVKSQRESNNKN